MTLQSIEAFWDQAAQPDGPPRDQYGRPMLIPRGGGPEDRQWYTRASSLADMIADFSHLHKWQMRYLCREMGRNVDLARLAAAEVYTTGFDKGDEKENRASGKRLDEIIDRALERGKIHEKADYGTAVHARTEPGNDGVDIDERQAIEVQSFKDKVARTGSVILGTEIFTANDDLRTAGTFDHLMYIPTLGIVITDKKTSSEVHGHDYGVQLASYAGADIYDWETDQRITLEEYVERLGWDPDLINRDTGVIHWIKNGRTSMHYLDLRLGREAAQRAIWVRDVHRKGTGQRKIDNEIESAIDHLRGELVTLIGAAESNDALLEIWNDRRNQALWTAAHTAAAAARKEALNG